MRTPGSSVPVEIRFGVSEIGRDVTARDFLRAVSLISACGPGVLLLGPARCADATPSPPKEGEKGNGVCVGAGSRGGVRVGTFGPRRPPQSSPPVGGKTRCWGCGVEGHLLRSCSSRKVSGGGGSGWSRSLRRCRGATVTGGPPSQAGARPGVVPPVASRPVVGPTPALSRPGSSVKTPRTAAAYSPAGPTVAWRGESIASAPCAAGSAIVEGEQTAAGGSLTPAAKVRKPEPAGALYRGPRVKGTERV